jgi:hypothetical protein
MGIVLSSKFIEQLDIAAYIVNVMPRASCQPVVMSGRDVSIFRGTRRAAEAEIEPWRKAT